MLYLCSSIVLRSECLEPFLSCCVPEREGKGKGGEGERGGKGGGEGKGGEGERGGGEGRKGGRGGGGRRGREEMGGEGRRGGGGKGGEGEGREGGGERRGEGKGRLREDLHFLVGLHAGVCFPLTLPQNISHTLITLRTALDTTHLHKS